MLYNGSFSQKLLHDKVKLLKLLPQLVNYKPDVYIAKKSSFYKHAIYYSPHMSLLKSMIAALENLKISTDNISIVETDIEVAKTLINSVSIPLQIKQHGLLHSTVFILKRNIYVCIYTFCSNTDFIC